MHSAPLSGPSRPRSAAGYTLTELLVTLGIVAVLAGIVFTTAYSVRASAAATCCAFNLRQVGMAVRLYVADYSAIPLVYYGVDGEMVMKGIVQRPQRPPSPPPSHTIQFVLRDYLAKDEMFCCPVLRGFYPNEPPKQSYQFENASSGYRLSKVRCGQGKVMLMADPFDRYCYRIWYAHARRANVLFLDGHVKAYKWVNWGAPPVLRDPPPIDCTPGNPSHW